MTRVVRRRFWQAHGSAKSPSAGWLVETRLLILDVCTAIIGYWSTVQAFRRDPVLETDPHENIKFPCLVGCKLSTIYGMWAGRKTVLSKDGNFHADFRAFADSLGFYRTIGATVATFEKVTRSFLSISYDSRTPDLTTSVAFSAPDPFNQTKTTRNTAGHNPVRLFREMRAYFFRTFEPWPPARNPGRRASSRRSMYAGQHSSLGAYCCRCRLTRLDVLVQAEQIGGIVFVL